MNPRVVVTNYGTGQHSVLLVNRSILRGVQKGGLLAADLTYQGPGADLGYNALEPFRAWVAEHGAPDILLGQACVALPVFRWAAEHCPDTMRVLQRDSTCAREHKILIDTEAERLGMGYRYGDEIVAHECAEYDLAHLITVLSRWVERSFTKHGYGDKTRYVSPQVIELENWNPMPRPNDGIAFRVLSAGSAGIRKGFPVLLRAWRMLRPEADEELVLNTVIPNQHTEELDLIREELRLTREVANVKMGGWPPLAQMPERYASCDVYCLASVEEGSTMTGLEAPACARAVVLTENCGSDILEQNNGLTGTMVRAGDEEALAEALDVYRRDLPRARAAGRTGRRKVEEMGGCERYEADFARVLREEWERWRGM